MKQKSVIFVLLYVIIKTVHTRDFYVGYAKKNDFLVSQDRLFKKRIPFMSAVAKYGKKFRCPLTYFRVVDRLGIGGGPKIKITRGGLGKTFLVLRLTSVYNYPLSVNIYVGCENKIKPTEQIKKPLRYTGTPQHADITKTTKALQTTTPMTKQTKITAPVSKTTKMKTTTNKDPVSKTTKIKTTTNKDPVSKTTKIKTTTNKDNQPTVSSAKGGFSSTEVITLTPPENDE